jgi:hypothetical protein
MSTTLWPRGFFSKIRQDCRVGRHSDAGKTYFISLFD